MVAPHGKWDTRPLREAEDATQAVKGACQSSMGDGIARDPWRSDDDGVDGEGDFVNVLDGASCCPLKCRDRGLGSDCLLVGQHGLAETRKWMCSLVEILKNVVAVVHDCVVDS